MTSRQEAGDAGGPHFCCEALAKEVTEHGAFAGGGWAYPAATHPTGQIEQNDDGTWDVNGCCGGGCCVITGMKFCPFCGTPLPGSASIDKTQKTGAAS